jgi:hypothetical protein
MMTNTTSSGHKHYTFTRSYPRSCNGRGILSQVHNSDAVVFFPFLTCLFMSRMIRECMMRTRLDIVSLGALPAFHQIISYANASINTRCCDDCMSKVWWDCHSLRCGHDYPSQLKATIVGSVVHRRGDPCTLRHGAAIVK